jgi:hypothetical protein
MTPAQLAALANVERKVRKAEAGEEATAAQPTAGLAGARALAGLRY